MICFQGNFYFLGSRDHKHCKMYKTLFKKQEQESRTAFSGTHALKLNSFHALVRTCCLKVTVLNICLLLPRQSLLRLDYFHSPHLYILGSAVFWSVRGTFSTLFFICIDTYNTFFFFKQKLTNSKALDWKSISNAWSICPVSPAIPISLEAFRF